MAMSTEKIIESLNEHQRKAVMHIDGPLLTLAGPGSGKTRVVTHRIAYMLDQGVSPYSILALTFTNKAAREMKARIDKMVPDCPVWMGTFHGYCARFLRRFGEMVGLTPNFTIFDTDDAKGAMKKAIEIAGVSLTHLNQGDISRRIGALKNKAISPEILEGNIRSDHDKIIGKVYPVYQKILRQFNAVDFDDLLMHTANILRANPDLRADLDAKHKYILVDEYQDTNLAQYLIVRGLSIDHPNLNVTGDPDQSIYSWRGADISNILSFEKDYPGTVTVRLEHNYRSTPQILSVADSLISCNTHRKAKALLPTMPDGGKVKYYTYASDREEADAIAKSIAIQVLEHDASPKDFAVLYRTNAQSRLIEQSLLRHKLNYQLIGGFRFYHREEIKDILAYLRLVHNPADDMAFDRVVNVPTRGLGAKSLAKVTDLSRQRDIPMLVALRAAVDQGLLSKKAATGASDFLKTYEKLVQLSAGPLLGVIDGMLQETGYIPYLTARKTETPDESIVGNINELRADAAQADSESDGGNVMERFLEQVTLISDTDGMNDVENKVTLMTLHAAKGLEFKNVFIIAVEHGVLPHMRSREIPSQLEEERRLLFVGITRAKEHLQMSMAKRRGFSSSMGCPSQFAMEFPRAELEIIDWTDIEAYEEGFCDDSMGDSSDDFEVYQDDEPKLPPKKTSKSFLHDGPRKSKLANLTNRRSQSVPGGSAGEVAGSKGASHSVSGSNDLLKGNLLHGKKTVLLSEDEWNQDVPNAIGDESQELPADAPAVEVAPASLQDLKSKLGTASLQSGASYRMITTKEGVEVSRFQVDSVVRHPEYGIGAVDSIEGHGVRRMARISFENGETKSFQLSKAPILLIEP